MRPVLCLSILLASGAWAGEATDRSAIEKAVYSLNTPVIAADLFTADFHDFAELARLRVQGQGGVGTVVISHEPWGEATWYPEMKLRLVIRSIRFITREVALVHAINQQLEDTSPESVPVLFVMKKEEADWRIASFRVLARPWPTTQIPASRF